MVFIYIYIFLQYLNLQRDILRLSISIYVYISLDILRLSISLYRQ